MNRRANRDTGALSLSGLRAESVKQIYGVLPDRGARLLVLGRFPVDRGTVPNVHGCACVLVFVCRWVVQAGGNGRAVQTCAGRSNCSVLALVQRVEARLERGVENCFAHVLGAVLTVVWIRSSVSARGICGNAAGRATASHPLAPPEHLQPPHQALYL